MEKLNYLAIVIKSKFDELYKTKYENVSTIENLTNKIGTFHGKGIPTDEQLCDGIDHAKNKIKVLDIEIIDLIKFCLEIKGNQ